METLYIEVDFTLNIIYCTNEFRTSEGVLLCVLSSGTFTKDVYRKIHIPKRKKF